MSTTFLELLEPFTTAANSNFVAEGLVHRFDADLDSSSVLQKGEAGTKIVLDVTVDGYRYVMTRTCCGDEQPTASLSPREREIIRMIARGMPNKTIARVLNISPYTVATHLKRIFAKLGVSSRAEMVARVLETVS